MMGIINYKLNFCRITIASKLFVRNNYFPLFKVLTPQDATKQIIKNNFTPKNHYMPVLLSHKRRERLSGGKRIKDLKNYGKRLHSKIDDFQYMNVVLKSDDDKHKKILDILKSKKKTRGNYVYKVEERNTCLIFDGPMEEAARNGEITDITISDNADKMIMRLKNGEKVTAEARHSLQDDALFWGEAATTQDTESKHHYGKMIMSIAHIFEMKERCAALYELEKMKFEAKKKQRVEREWKNGMEPLLENLIRENEANKENEQNNHELDEIENKEFKMNIADMSKTLNISDKLLNDGQEVIQKLPCMKEINRTIKRLGEGQYTERGNTPGVLLKVGDEELFIIGQMVQTEKEEIFVPGQTFETTNGVKYLPGITVNLDNTPTFVTGVIMADDTNSAVFLPGQSTITSDGKMRFMKEGERVTPVGMKKLQMSEDEQWERIEKRRLAREKLEREKLEKQKAEAKERKKAKKEKLDRKKARLDKEKQNQLEKLTTEQELNSTMETEKEITRENLTNELIINEPEKSNERHMIELEFNNNEIETFKILHNETELERLLPEINNKEVNLEQKNIITNRLPSESEIINNTEQKLQIENNLNIIQSNNNLERLQLQENQQNEFKVATKETKLEVKEETITSKEESPHLINSTSTEIEQAVLQNIQQNKIDVEELKSNTNLINQDKITVEQQQQNLENIHTPHMTETENETKLITTQSNENMTCITTAEDAKTVSTTYDDLGDFSVPPVEVVQKTEEDELNEMESELMKRFNEEILAGIFLQDHTHLLDAETIENDKEMMRAKYLLAQQEEERKKNAQIADNMKDVLDILEMKKTKLLEKLRNIQNETSTYDDRSVTYIYPAKANALAIELGFDGQIARNVAKILLGITRWANTFSAKFHVHSENIDIISYSSEIDEEFHNCSDSLKCALKAAMVAAVEVFKHRPQDLEGGMRAAGKMLHEAIDENGLIIHEIALTLDHKTNSERNVLFSSTLKDLTKKLIVNKAETLRSIIREEYKEEKLITKINLVIEEEGDILVRAFTNLTNNNPELVKQVYTNVINTASDLICEEKSGDVAHRAIVNAVQEIADDQLNKFLKTESAHAVKHLLLEAFNLAEIVGMKNEAKTIDRLLQEEDVVSIHVLATDQITLDILRRVLIMRQLADRNPHLRNGLMALRREPRKAREDRNTRELVRESAAVISHACPILSSLDIPSFLFELGNNLAMEDFLVQRIKKDGALLISKKGIQAVVPKEASRFVLSGLISYTLIDDKGVTSFKPMHVFNALKLGKQQEKMYHDYSCVGAFDKYAYSVPVRESLDYNYRNYLNPYYNNQCRDDVCTDSGDWACWQLDTGKRRAAAAGVASGVRRSGSSDYYDDDNDDLVVLEATKRTMRPAAVHGGHRAY